MAANGTAPTITPKRLLNEITRTGESSLVVALRSAIRAGRIPNGARLPTVRSVAEVLQTSTGRVATAWSNLRAEGLIETHRRGGTFISHGNDNAEPSRPSANRWLSVDLANGLADPQLQPSLEKALLSGAKTHALNSPYPEPITAALKSAVLPTWPFEPEALATAGGGSEGILLAIQAASERGRTVAIEEPTSPRLIEMIELLGLRPIPVHCDDNGPTPQSLQAALDHKPSAFIYQPRAHIPLGHRVSDKRLEHLAKAIEQHDRELWIVEDDNTGPIAMMASGSLGTYLPSQVIHMRAYCRTYGLDLRTSVIGGVRTLVERTVALRSKGFGMTSRILQNALAYLIEDSGAQEILEKARSRYAWRRESLIAALSERGLKASNPDGVIVWLPVQDERSALLNLASYGITVGSGQRCFIEDTGSAHLRIASSCLPDDAESIANLADMISRAVSGQSRLDFD